MIFSFVVPVYNVEQYLRQCVNSILMQSFSDFEIILVNDGSTDHSGEICDEFAQKDQRIRVIHKGNGGLSDARNAGLRVASGEYVLFVDSDDYVSENALADIAESIFAGEKPELVCLECTKVFSDSKTKVPMNDGITEEINGLREDALYLYLAERKKFPAAAWSKAIRRDFLLENELYFDKGRLSEDLEWALRLFVKVSDVWYCPTEYYFYRQKRDGSITNSASEKNFRHICDTEKLGDALAKQETNPSKKKMLFSFMEFMYVSLILGYGKIAKENKKSYKETLKKYDYVLGTRKDKRSRIIAFSYRILGIRVSRFLLKRYMVMRE